MGYGDQAQDVKKELFRFLCGCAAEFAPQAALVSKVRNWQLRTLAAAEFPASTFTTLRSTRKVHPRACTRLGDFHTAPAKLRSPGRLGLSKVRRPIALRTLEIFRALVFIYFRGKAAAGLP